MAEKLIEQQWLLYGESSYPSWLLGPALALGVLLSIWWLRGETRKKGISGALLPFTWTFMLVLTIWLAWKPALVKILKWENQKKILVYLDRSDSMSVPLLSSDVATRLDHLAHWDPVLAGKRNAGPADLRKALVDLSEETAEILQALETAEEEFVQGIPHGQSSMKSLARIPDWASETRARILDFVSDVSIHKGQNTEFPATGIQELVKAIEFLPGKANPSSAESLQAASRSIRTLRAAGSNLLPELKALQASLDRSFVQENATALKPIFERMSSQSRLEAATSILESMEKKNLTLFEDRGPPDRTDIYDVLEQLLSGREGEVISHLFVLSDGGHNGAGRSDISEKIRKSGITLTTVGIGTPESGVDLAILDWNMPRVIKARRQQQLMVTIKTRGPEGIPFKVVLEQEGKEIASTSAETSGLKQDQVQLSFKSPPAGRHTLTLRIDRADVNTRNNQVHFVLNTVKRTPASLMIGDLPDWDTTFLHLALERAQIESRQIYSGIEKGPPGRGGSPRSIPKSLAQWSRNRLVILQGAPFKGLSAEDINTLYSYVTQEGGSLLILTEERDSYQKALAAKFGWPEKAATLQDARLRLSDKAQHLPFLRLGFDGPHSARIISSLGACEMAFEVPRQDLSILENGSGKPILSLGFYGKGKVFIWGIKGIYPLREYQKAKAVDRLLTQLVEEAVAPLFPTEETKLTPYPVLPVSHKENLLISLTEASRAELSDSPALDLKPGVENRIGRLVPEKTGELRISVSGESTVFHAISNPGLEQIDFEFNEKFLSDFAEASGGQYLSFRQAGSKLNSIRPEAWYRSTAERYPLADHWLLLCLIAVTGTLHWSLRKISGLPL